jgi:hypothetical protein
MFHLETTCRHCRLVLASSGFAELAAGKCSQRKTPGRLCLGD